MQNNCYKYVWKKKKGRKQPWQTEEKTTRATILVCFFPVMATTAQKDPPTSILIFSPSSWLVGFPCIKNVPASFLRLQPLSCLSSDGFKHHIPWGKAAESVGLKHWTRSQHETRLGRTHMPSQLCKQPLWRAARSWLMDEASQEGSKKTSKSSQQPSL